MAIDHLGRATRQNKRELIFFSFLLILVNKYDLQLDSIPGFSALDELSTSTTPLIILVITSYLMITYLISAWDDYNNPQESQVQVKLGKVENKIENLKNESEVVIQDFVHAVWNQDPSPTRNEFISELRIILHPHIVGMTRYYKGDNEVNYKDMTKGRIESCLKTFQKDLEDFQSQKVESHIHPYIAHANELRDLKKSLQDEKEKNKISTLRWILDTVLPPLIFALALLSFMF